MNKKSLLTQRETRNSVAPSYASDPWLHPQISSIRLLATVSKKAW